MIPSTKQPYLSVVATARNDDHGGNLLRRVQTFLNALAAQSKRYNLPIELVLVEWNPPQEKPPLCEVLRWPAGSWPFQARIVTVPPDIHRRYRCAEALPLYQMIAKNAGIRRARGEFILATNIDILLSDELMQFLGSQNLERGRLYRIDRTDVASDVPVDAPIEEQLAYCRAHRIRLNAIDGTFPLTPEGVRKQVFPDLAPPESGISFGTGWYAPEQYFGQLFRWSTGDSVIHFAASQKLRTLLLEIESGPSTGFGPFRIQLLDPAGGILAESPVEKRRSCIWIPVSGECTFVRLRVSAGMCPSDGDPRTLVFRVLRCQWTDPPEDGLPLAVSPAPVRPFSRAWLTAKAGVRFLAGLRRGNGTSRVSFPIPLAFRHRLEIHTQGPSIVIALGAGSAAVSPAPEVRPALLHTNACGDFTLAHRDHWFELRGYPEFDLYSMNIDSLFCFMAHYGGAAEEILREPMRIYHVEHAVGSGWTPEGSRLLFDRLATNGIPWIEYDEVLRWASLMERLRTTLVFNREDWGLGEIRLPERDMSPPA